MGCEIKDRRPSQPTTLPQPSQPTSALPEAPPPLPPAPPRPSPPPPSPSPSTGCSSYYRNSNWDDTRCCMDTGACETNSCAANNLGTDFNCNRNRCSGVQCLPVAGCDPGTAARCLGLTACEGSGSTCARSVPLDSICFYDGSRSNFKLEGPGGSACSGKEYQQGLKLVSNWLPKARPPSSYPPVLLAAVLMLCFAASVTAAVGSRDDSAVQPDCVLDDTRKCLGNTACEDGTSSCEDSTPLDTICFYDGSSNNFKVCSEDKTHGATAVPHISIPAQPLPALTQPVTSPAQPLPALTQPVTIPAQPLPALTQPVTIPAQPLPALTQPVTCPAQPLPALTQPVTCPAQPLPALTQPVTIPAQPLPALTQPVTCPAQPLPALTQPVTCPAQPLPALTQPVTCPAQPLPALTQPVSPSH
ncbi:hypothetical protein V8C86DRAFT_3150345 [Haematococcus lacustris]